MFGCHVSAVFRRLQRLCAFYGGRPQYIGCSATIANGGQHFERLVIDSLVYGHLKSCMTDIYLDIDARTADYIHTHPYTHKDALGGEV